MSFFNTESYIKSLPIVNIDEVFLCENYDFIEKICKKIDVVKKIYTQYDYDISKKKSNEEICKDSYLHLMHFFLSLSESTRDYKYINTSLKLMDVISRCMGKECYLIDERIRLVELIKGRV